MAVKTFLNKVAQILSLGAFIFLGACSNATPEPHEVGIIAVPAAVPEGVIRYCWEEPMVKLEKNGPGLDEENRWYSPSYVAVREVRSGRWRPCQPEPNEVTGDLRR